MYIYMKFDELIEKQINKFAWRTSSLCSAMNTTERKRVIECKEKEE